MKKTLVISMMVIVVVAAALVGGALAAFTDAESSADNSFQVGTLDLKTDDADGVTQTLYGTSMKPGDVIGPATIILKNSGSIDGSSLDLDVSYLESDGSPNSINRTADETAAVIRVDTLEYAEVSLLGSVADGNGNGYKDVQDLGDSTLTGLPGIDALATRDFTVQVTLNTTDNDFQADGVDIDFTFTLKD